MVLQMKITEGFMPDRLGTSVNWDDYDVGFTQLCTDGIGSCVAIALYASEAKKGILAHISGNQWPTVTPTKIYPENIVNTMVSNLGTFQKIEAVLAGESERETKISDLIKKKLYSLKIPIIGEDLGDVPVGREMLLDCSTGTVNIYRYPETYQ
jgi:chemotaxis receptor (MCP) glutamine deamidase CheD